MNAVHTATRKTRSIMALGAVALTLSLAACGDKTETAQAGAAARPATANIDEKYNAYVSGFNRLQTNQTQKSAEDWIRIDVAKNDMKNNIYFFNNDNQIVQAVDSLKAGRAMKVDGTEAADRAADKLIENGDALAAQLREMNPYFKSAAYRDDKLAKAKAADAPMRAAYTGVLQGMEQMEAALGAHQKKRDTERAEAYKKAGNMTGYHLTIATLRGNAAHRASQAERPASHVARQHHRSVEQHAGQLPQLQATQGAARFRSDGARVQLRHHVLERRALNLAGLCCAARAAIHVIPDRLRSASLK